MALNTVKTAYAIGFNYIKVVKVTLTQCHIVFYEDTYEYLN